MFYLVYYRVRTKNFNNRENNMIKNNSICGECNKHFYRKPSQIKKLKNNKIFCSMKCYRNYYDKNKYYIQSCDYCGKPVKKLKSKKKYLKTGKVFCDNLCKRKFPFESKLKGVSKIENIPLSHYATRKDANRYAAIRDNARRVTSNRQQECQKCGYNKHVEVCHVKDIKDFPLTALVGEINSKDNLILLCPNCHWELDHGLLTHGFARDRTDFNRL